jgi:hypothetical protein
MTWQRIAPKVLRREPDTIRFSYRQDKGIVRVFVRIGYKCLTAVKWKLGDQVEVVWDGEKCLLGFRKSEDGRTLTGRHKSGVMIMPRVGGAFGKAIAAMVDREIHPQVEHGMLVIDCREVLK